LTTLTDSQVGCVKDEQRLLHDPHWLMARHRPWPDKPVSLASRLKKAGFQYLNDDIQSTMPKPPFRADWRWRASWNLKLGFSPEAWQKVFPDRWDKLVGPAPGTVWDPSITGHSGCEELQPLEVYQTYYGLFQHRQVLVGDRVFCWGVLLMPGKNFSPKRFSFTKKDHGQAVDLSSGRLHVVARSFPEECLGQLFLLRAVSGKWSESNLYQVLPVVTQTGEVVRWGVAIGVGPATKKEYQLPSQDLYCHVREAMGAVGS
jgi:hypothetical protein